MSRRTENSEESIDIQEGAGQPVQLLAVSVEHHRRRIMRRPVVARAQQFRRRLSGKLHPRRVVQIQSKASAEKWEPQSLHLAAVLDLY